MKGKVKRINDILGSILFCYYISIVTYFMMVPDVFGGFRHKTHSAIIIYMHMSITSIFWIVTAHYHDNVINSLQEWLDYQTFQNKEMSTFPQEVLIKVNSIRSELASGLESFALGTYYFPVTTKFLRAVQSVLF